MGHETPVRKGEMTMASVVRAQSATSCDTIVAKSNIPVIRILIRSGRGRTMFCLPTEE